MESKKMRCHFSIIFEKAGSFLVFWLIVVVNQMDDIIKIITAPDFSLKSVPYILPACLGLTLLLLLIVGYQFLVWRKTFIYLDGDTFIVERNTLNRKKSTFAIPSIANINLEQNLFERLVGTYRLKLDTDSFSSADSTDVSIVLSAPKATALKAELLTLIKKAPHTQNTSNFERTESSENISYASTKEVLSHCFFSISTGLLFWTLAIVIGLPLFLYFNNLSLWDILSEDTSSVLGRFLAILLLIVTYVYSLLKQLLSFYHFRCFRQGNDIRIQYGFLKKQDFTIPLERINSIQISQPPLARLTGRLQAQLICIGVGDSDAEKPQLTLCMKKETFYARLQELLPEFSTSDIKEIHNLPKGSGISYLISCLFFLLVFSGCFWGAASLFGNKGSDKTTLLVSYGIVAFFIILYQLFHFFSIGTQLTDKQLIIHGGAFRKQIWLIPYRKIQFATFHQNPISRIFHIFKGDINILASSANNTIPLPFTSQNEINTLKEELLD